MENLYDEFIKNLHAYHRDECIELIKNELKSGSKVYDLYMNVIIPACKSYGQENDFGKYNIVNEHACTAIIRSVIENCSYSVKTQSKKSNFKKVLVCGLDDELHEIGSRMISDYFALAGFDTIFLGCNLPNESIFKAIELLKPDYLAISVTNFYHLPKLNEIVNNVDVQIILGGQAFTHNMQYECDQCKIILDVEDIEVLSDEVSV